MRHSVFPFLLMAVFSFILGSCNQQSEYSISHNQDFNDGWKFSLQDVEGAESYKFNDSQWRDIHLPHDWSIEVPEENGITSSKDSIGWYRKSFTLPKLSGGLHVILHFEGVQSMMQLWVNGDYVGEHTSAYIPYYFNLTPYIKQRGGLNQLAVRIRKPLENSLNEEGAGICRSVSLSIVSQVSVDVDGVSVTTPEITTVDATIYIDLRLKNYSKDENSVIYGAKIFGPRGSLFIIPGEDLSIPGDKIASVSLSKTIKNPILWDTDNPELYTAVIDVWKNDKQIESYATIFGIRSNSYSVDNGFQLNEKEVLLRGARLKHTNGLLGSASYPDAEERKVERLKKNGFNVIRTSQIPPSEAFLSACDKNGMLVLNESRVSWESNHPSVIMCSIPAFNDDWLASNLSDNVLARLDMQAIYSNCSDLDLIGYRNPKAFYRNVIWGKSNMEIMVHAPEYIASKVPDDCGWPDELNSWTWPGLEQKPIAVRTPGS